MPVNFQWTDEQIAILRALTLEGKSAAYIGKVLGVSKNSVIGKRHRLDINLARKDVRESLPPRPRTYKPRAPTFGKPVPITQLHQLHCKAIVAPGKYCAEPVHRRSFCTHHFARYYYAQQKVASRVKVFA